MKFSAIKTYMVIITVMFSTANLLPQQGQKKSVNKISADSVKYAKFNINKISTYIYNNGLSDFIPNAASGFVYPAGSGATAIYSTGLLWGGIVDGQLMVGGTQYNSGLAPGRIVSEGIAANPQSPGAGIFRVRPDYQSAGFSAEIRDGEGSAAGIYAKYEHDWNNWPAAEGAPYTDMNDNGVYDPSVDIPGVPGASQTIWFVANDLDSVLTKKIYGFLPMGLEVQVTVWGYDSPVLDHMYFKKYKLINKSGKDISDMYLGIWSDPDLGYPGDDFVGCDTLLNIGYCYNANVADYEYKAHGNLDPPAVGYALLQGPLVDGSPSDSAVFDGSRLYGKKNLPMTSFIYFAGGDYYLGDPASGSQYGGHELYNFMRGLYGLPGTPFVDYITGKPTSFVLSGDPVTKQGWIDGLQLPPGDRRMMSSVGPFQLAASDTQEVVFAEIGAGADNGADHIAAITYLKNYAAAAAQFVQSNFEAPQPPPRPDVKGYAYDKTGVLVWGENINDAKKKEGSIIGNYGFQGYDVYQFSSPDIKTAKAIKVATFDFIDSVSIIYDYVPDTVNGGRIYTAVQKGLNSGLQRYFIFDKDYFTGVPLHNGTKYYYGVTSYNYNPADKIIPASLESTPQILTLVPQVPLPGERYGAGVNEMLPVKHIAGQSNGVVNPVVINPAELNGHNYRVSFKNAGGKTLWDLTDETSGALLLENQGLNGSPDGYFVTGGFILKFLNYSLPVFAAGDVYTFTTPKNYSSQDLAKDDVKEVNVFPNPYYGYNSGEETSAGKFITFSHLPEKATIKIFDLSGRLVRTLHKDDTDQYYRFYLFTDANTPLGSGVYIAYINMPELGTTKILKFAVITPQVVPDHY